MSAFQEMAGHLEEMLEDYRTLPEEMRLLGYDEDEILRSVEDYLERHKKILDGLRFAYDRLGGLSLEDGKKHSLGVTKSRRHIQMLMMDEHKIIEVLSNLLP